MTRPLAPRLLPTGLFHVLVAIVFALSGCAALPERLPLGAPGYALSPQPGGLLADLESRVRHAHGTEQSAFLLLDANQEALRWRLALIDSARHSLDLQYYVWWGDEVGDLLLARVIAAADRGVKVRLILDDLSTILEDETHPRLRDASTALVDAHPNIEIRLFNAWRSRPLAGRAVEVLERMERINHRMHNKLLVADNRAAIVGGRNLGNEYFGLSPEFNFRDLDVLGIGPVARQASAVFDTFWNSNWVTPAAALPPADAAEAKAADPQVLRTKLAAAPSLAAFPLEAEDWTGRFEQMVPLMHPGTSRVHTDTPDESAVTHHMPAAIRALMATAESELLIANAYIIPGQHALDRTRDLVNRGVDVRILTNSLASHDVPAVNSHYQPWRKPLLEAGVRLYEVRPDAATQPALADTPPTRAKFMGFHVKAMVIDERRVFVGSMNLDPRSWSINSEMGVVIDSPGLARELAATVKRDMAPENAWQVTLDGNGELVWAAGGQELRQQPARSTWQRVENVFFTFFPRDLY
jgi:putative cardiolipin synthase